MARRVRLADAIASGFLLAALGVIPVAAGYAARMRTRTLERLTPVLEALRSTGGWLEHHAHGLGLGGALVGTGLLAVILFRRLRSTTPRGENLQSGVASAVLLLAFSAAAMELWVVALTLAVIIGVMAAMYSTGQRPLLTPRRTWAVLLLILLTGAFLRFVLVMDHAVGFGTHGMGHLQLSIDFVEHALARVSTSPRRFELSTYLRAQHGPMAVVNALGFMVFGVGFAQARLTQAVLGTVTIWLAFLFGRRLMDAKTGLVCAFLMAVSPWQVAISRFNDAEHVLAPLQALLAAWAVLRADHDRRFSTLVLAGVACALGWYVYAANQVLLVILVGYLGWRILRVRGKLGHRWRTLATFLLVFIAASLPDLLATVHPGHCLPIRTSYELGKPGPYSVMDPRSVVENIGVALDTLYRQADDPWFSKTTGGGLDGLVALLFPAGLAWCIAGLVSDRVRSSAVLLLAWTGTGLLPAIVLRHVEFRRFVLVELAAEVMAAIILVEAGRLIARTSAGRRALLVIVPTAALVWCALATFIYWDRVTVPESRRSTYYVALAREVWQRLGHEPVVAVLAANGDQGREHRDAIRLGAYPEVRGLAVQGVPLERTFHLTPVQNVGAVLRKELLEAGRVRIVVEKGLADRIPVRRELKRAILSRDPRARAQLIYDSLGNPVLVAWTVVSGESPDRRLPP